MYAYLYLCTAPVCTLSINICIRVCVCMCVCLYKRVCCKLCALNTIVDQSAQECYFIIIGICHCSKSLYAVQFHPEVDLTKNGTTMLRNFLYNISGCSGSFTIKSRELQCINYIKEKIGNAKVLVREIIPYQDI